MSDEFKYSPHLTEKITVEEVSNWLEHDFFPPKIAENPLFVVSLDGAVNALWFAFPIELTWLLKSRFRRMAVKCLRAVFLRLEEKGAVIKGKYSQYHWNSPEYTKAMAEQNATEEKKKEDWNKIVTLCKRLGVSINSSSYGDYTTLDRPQMLAIVEFLNANGFQMPEAFREKVEAGNASET